MRIGRWIACAACAIGLAGPVTAGDGLRSLDTMDEARDWEAVGRLDMDGTGFCTGALIAPDLVLTAAHCMFDKHTKKRVDYKNIEFRAGWRNGRASAYRNVRRAVIHPSYQFEEKASTERVRNDVALLELERPIQNTTVIPFKTARNARRGDEVGIVSYARGRSEAPSLEEVCAVLEKEAGVLVMSCSVDFGASGSPIFTFEQGAPRIVSVVSAKAELDGQRVALGTSLAEQLNALKAQLSAGQGYEVAPATHGNRIRVGEHRTTGAKFVRP